MELKTIFFPTVLEGLTALIVAVIFSLMGMGEEKESFSKIFLLEMRSFI